MRHYAAVGHGQAPLLAEGIHVRYVVAQPVHLPVSGGGPASRPCCRHATASIVRTYGMDGDVPRYALPSLNLADLRAAYLAKDITYLLGMDDTDPDHHQLESKLRGRSARPDAAATWALVTLPQCERAGRPSRPR